MLKVFALILEKVLNLRGRYIADIVHYQNYWEAKNEFLDAFLNYIKWKV